MLVALAYFDSGRKLHAGALWHFRRISHSVLNRYTVAWWLGSRVVRVLDSDARVQISVTTLSGNSLRQTVHTHRASVHQAAKLVAALLGVAEVTAGLAESNGSLPPGL